MPKTLALHVVYAIVLLGAGIFIGLGFPGCDPDPVPPSTRSSYVSEERIDSTTKVVDVTPQPVDIDTVYRTRVVHDTTYVDSRCPLGMGCFEARWPFGPVSRMTPDSNWVLITGTVDNTIYGVTGMGLKFSKRYVLLPEVSKSKRERLDSIIIIHERSYEWFSAQLLAAREFKQGLWGAAAAAQIQSEGFVARPSVAFYHNGDYRAELQAGAKLLSASRIERIQQ